MADVVLKRHCKLLSFLQLLVKLTDELIHCCCGGRWKEHWFASLASLEECSFT